ncbi:cytochrome b [Ketobacter sp.]
MTESNLFNSIQSYGWVSIAIHWLSFLMAAFIFGIGLYMVELTYYDTLYNVLPEWHKAVGLMLGVLTLIRLLWVAFNVSPAFEGESGLQAVLARIAHFLLYCLIIVLTFSGYIIVTADGSDLQLFGHAWLGALFELTSDQAEWAGRAHRWIAYGFAALVVLHATAALYHHLFHHDNTLKRMLFPQSIENGD